MKSFSQGFSFKGFLFSKDSLLNNVKKIIKVKTQKNLLCFLFLILCSSAMCNIILAKPNIVILATGGTIAGVANQVASKAKDANSNDSQDFNNKNIITTDYKAGSLSINTLIDAVPEIKNLANIRGEQIANIDSADMTDEIWLKLARRINWLLKSDKVDGIVITHGTDTMEESAYFLHLTIKSPKPVVLTGAMRPSSAMSADGPKNLYNAVALAVNPDSKNKGVMVVMNDKVQSAREVSKTHTINVETFKSLNSGDMGYIIDGVVFFHYAPRRPHTTKSIFDVENLEKLPKVDILYTYANDGLGVAAKALLKAGAKGIIVAGSGAGSIHTYQKEILKSLIKQGLIVVKSSRVGSGIVQNNDEDERSGFIAANDLNPQKARVLLMLALTKSSDPKEAPKFIKKIFSEY